ncbi:MAG: protein kinase [Blastocatellia bacterium]|nr:protein kinase [Blastocatellia bacterium]MCS7158463.1 protein kinase [Blastocatellia bacterium]MDW8255891.1 protein kinase [Acidobacteriota bacterium]
MVESKMRRDPYGFVGTVLADRYRVEELVGIGGMGVVYRARHLVTTATVAVKVLKPDLALSCPDLVEVFFKEAKATVALDHPYIIRVTDAAMTRDGLPFLVMEWLSGHTLEEELRRHGPLSLERVALFLDQIAEALAYAHARGLVHRDLKPSNLMLVTDYKGEPIVKILDFGIAKALPGATSARVSRPMGTLHYASPEQFRSGAAIDHRSDIYSLGIVAYQMLTGRVPFEAESLERVIYAHLHEQPPSPRRFRPDVPAAVEEVFVRALAKNPEDRFSSAVEMARAFRQAIGLEVGKLRLRCEDAETRAGVAAALVYVDGRYAGRTDAEGNCEIEGLSPRAHLLEVESARHHRWRGTVHLESGKASVVLLRLDPLHLGSIFLQCAVAGADVFLDGERVGVTDERGTCALERVPIGRHRITVRHPQYVPAHAACEVIEGEMVSLMLALRPRRWHVLSRWLAFGKRETMSAASGETRATRPSPETLPDTVADVATQGIVPTLSTQEMTRSWRMRSRRALALGLVSVGLLGGIFALRSWRKSPEVTSSVVQRPQERSLPESSSSPSETLARPESPRERAISSSSSIRRPHSRTSPSVSPGSLPESPSEATPAREPSSHTEETTSAALTVAEHVRRGNENFNAGRYDEALREYQAAQQLDPANPDVYYLLGLVYERRGEYDAAREAFERCTAGPYAAVARNHLKMLEKKRRKP